MWRSPEELTKRAVRTTHPHSQTNTRPSSHHRSAIIAVRYSNIKSSLVNIFLEMHRVGQGKLYHCAKPESAANRKKIAKWISPWRALAGQQVALRVAMADTQLYSLEWGCG